MSADTPYPLDPFTFVAEKYVAANKQAQHDTSFAIPPLPDHLKPVVTTTRVAPSEEKITATPPKHPFPTMHLAFLESKITELATGSLVVILETVHHALREHKVKKKAIEAKIREIAEKCKEKKVWVLKMPTAVS